MARSIYLGTQGSDLSADDSNTHLVVRPRGARFGRESEYVAADLLLAGSCHRVL